MKGFDPEFEDLVDYILVITERIWEGREVGAIRRYYAEDCIVRTPLGVTAHVDDMVAGILATLHAFPDRRQLGEDVIWSGDEQTGFLSSHCILSPMHHRGDGTFGPATGKFVCARTIADCAVKDNRITEEWLVRDQAAIVKQIGRDPRKRRGGALCRYAAANLGRERPRGDRRALRSGRAARVAARWSVRGTHSGHGAFGAPSGAEIYIMGICHAEIVGGKILREWVLVDELAIWRQIAIATG